MYTPTTVCCRYPCRERERGRGEGGREETGRQMRERKRGEGGKEKEGRRERVDKAVN